MNWIINAIKNLDKQSTVNLIIAVIILAIFDIFSPILSYIIIKMFNLKKNAKEIKNNTFYIPLKGFFQITGIYLSILFLKHTFIFSDGVMIILTKIYKIIVTIVMANSLANSITRKSRFINKIKEKSDRNIDESTTRILVRGIKTLIYILAAFIVFSEIGYDLSGLVTGLGLGSVVLTLAAQDTIKNLLGGIVIFMDKPFKVGDNIKFSTYQGTVEDMTFRSTRIRTLDNSIIQIPNSCIVSDSVENLSKIQKRRYKLNLELVLDTKMEQIDTLKKKIIELLSSNEDVLQETVNVHFNEIGSNGFNLMVISYFNVSNYIKFLDLQEEVNKNIMQIVNEENIGLAYDTKTIEIKK